MADQTERLTTLWALATAGHGVIVTKALRQAGFTSHQIAAMVRVGQLTREFRGIYRIGFKPASEVERRVAACTATNGMLSHQSAARFFGFTEFGPEEVHVIGPLSNPTRGAPWLVIHSTTRPDNRPIRARGFLVTSPLRTLLDLAGLPGRAVTDEQLTGFVDHCVATRRFTIAELKKFLTSHGRFMRGRGRLADLLRDWFDSDSAAEAAIVRLLRAAGIERPVTRFVLKKDARFVARIDIAWPPWKVALEVDGYPHHAGYGNFHRDRRRGNAIVTAGWLLLRTTPAEARNDPEGLVSAVKAALARAKAAAA